ncbi:tRNA threonylcarbamoyl adenosine modification protein YeaZ [Afipia massiliensis]|uniref:tRNA threonylcarbamoyl adenosine modification protein YeaZ n=1 Tax=Afipia massiliensis TaxID=211460 RepID=A0A840N657_9BRAD|nr:tRNA (adenosine(37)-N6)-threonylcarbamoyltransferase complex dimerization subunit type 1 TsaB [Afipia massiliensis]MBB5052196.1 tRNA threonylcarbamoyl adenosine modification protein YeaZ [Afipia massiliensis]
MIVLAIDTALDYCAAAVLDASARTMIAHETLEMKRGHAEALMPLIARVMNASGQRYLDLDRVAVTTGPGSFTGLRVGISAARGIGLAADKPVIGLTTLSAYVAPLVAEQGEQPIIAAIDARHDHVYFQVVAGNGSALMRPAVVPIEDTFTASRFGALRMVGNAARILADRWPRNVPAPSLVDPKPGPDIAWVAWIGAATEPDASPPKPFYLRLPDAKPKAGFSMPDARS